VRWMDEVEIEDIVWDVIEQRISQVNEALLD
jgi:hypothetical protein